MDAILLEKCNGIPYSSRNALLSPKNTHKNIAAKIFKYIVQSK